VAASVPEDRFLEELNERYLLGSSMRVCIEPSVCGYFLHETDSANVPPEEAGKTAPFGTVPRTLHLPTYGAVVYKSLPIMRHNRLYPRTMVAYQNLLRYGVKWDHREAAVSQERNHQHR
jgi:hypothetical protein